MFSRDGRDIGEFGEKDEEEEKRDKRKITLLVGRGTIETRCVFSMT